MGKTIIVFNIKECKQCFAYEKFGCYYCNCDNKYQMLDNIEKNKLLYEVKN